jgi:hypothetical protein
MTGGAWAHADCAELAGAAGGDREGRIVTVLEAEVDPDMIIFEVQD